MVADEQPIAGWRRRAEERTAAAERARAEDAQRKRDEKGVWTIPSHGNSPADANDQMGKAAAMLIGLKKDSIVGDAKGRHAEYDLIDPFAEGVETKGRGKRLKLKDSAGNVLADLIIGKEIEGKDGKMLARDLGHLPAAAHTHASATPAASPAARAASS